MAPTPKNIFSRLENILKRFFFKVELYEKKKWGMAFLEVNFFSSKFRIKNNRYFSCFYFLFLVNIYNYTFELKRTAIYFISLYIYIVTLELILI